MASTSKAVIVAAGMSSRLMPLTAETPKVLLEAGGEGILGRSVRLLKERGFNDILVVVGYLKEKVMDSLGGGIKYVFNPRYRETNNMGSLWYAKEWIGAEPFLYLHGDLVYEPELLDAFLGRSYDDAALLVDFGPVGEEAMKVRTERGRFVESNKEVPLGEAAGEWVGIALFSRPAELFDTIEALLEDGHLQAYDTQAFNEMAGRGSAFTLVPTEGRNWVEVDFIEDLKRARELFR